MNFEIIKDFKNPLLKRREIELKKISKIVPSKKELSEEIAKKFNVDFDLVKIFKIKQKFGTQEFMVEFFIYDDKKALDEIHKIPKKIKKKLHEKEKEIHEKEKEKVEKEKTEKAQKKSGEKN